MLTTSASCDGEPKDDRRRVIVGELGDDPAAKAEVFRIDEVAFMERLVQEMFERDHLRQSVVRSGDVAALRLIVDEERMGDD